MTHDRLEPSGVCVRSRLVVLGCGYAGLAIARLARERGHTGHLASAGPARALLHVRNPTRAAALSAEGFDTWCLPVLDSNVAEAIDERTHVVIAFPPDGATDERVAPWLTGAAAITYISSTGVYGDHRGTVDDTTSVSSGAVTSESGTPSEDPRAARLLAAEEVYRGLGAIVFRCPALYGRDRGLHVRVVRGEHRIPGDGTRFISRIHVDDLAQFVLAAGATPRRPAHGETFAIGDEEPARHIDVVRFVCNAYGVPMPAFVPIEGAHESLRADRRVDSSHAIARFNVSLRYPTYRQGMAPAATGLCAP